MKILTLKLFPLLLLTVLQCTAFAQTNFNQITQTVSPDDGITHTAILNMAGICAVIRKLKDTDKTIIIETIKNGASDKAGLLANDEIIQIDSSKIQDMDVNSVVPLLRGEPGTKVKLTIKRQGHADPLIFDVTRELVKLPISK